MNLVWFSERTRSKAVYEISSELKCYFFMKIVVFIQALLFTAERSESDQKQANRAPAQMIISSVMHKLTDKCYSTGQAILK